jgi:Cu(I)/Ag(I) efflux system membrane protein CusA/SilA
MSVTKAKQVLQQTDKIIRQFPEVHHVYGKIGRAETATDPAGLDMVETTIMLKPEEEWRPGMTIQKLINELDAALQIPGFSNVWTMPIKNRVDMLSTGIKTPVGIKISGADLKTLEAIGKEVEAVVKQVPGTLSAFAERAIGGNYIDYAINRDEAARYGLTVDDIHNTIQSAMGGMPVTTTVEGLERYTVNLRYSRELRDNLEALQRVLIPTPTGQQIPLSQVTTVSVNKGPMVIRTEDTRPNVWIYVDIKDIDVGTYVKMAKRMVAESTTLPAGYNIVWSGQYEYMERAKERLMYVIPLTILIIFIIIYLNTRSVTKTMIVFLAVPFSLVGAIWLLYVLGYNLSIAVWVGGVVTSALMELAVYPVIYYLWKGRGMREAITD